MLSTFFTFSHIYIFFSFFLHHHVQLSSPFVVLDVKALYVTQQNLLHSTKRKGNQVANLKPLCPLPFFQLYRASKELRYITVNMHFTGSFQHRESINYSRSVWLLSFFYLNPKSYTFLFCCLSTNFCSLNFCWFWFDPTCVSWLRAAATAMHRFPDVEPPNPWDSTSGEKERVTGSEAQNTALPRSFICLPYCFVRTGSGIVVAPSPRWLRAASHTKYSVFG